MVRSQASVHFTAYFQKCVVEVLRLVSEYIMSGSTDRCDLYMRVRPHVSDAAAWVAVDAGAGPVHDGKGDLRGELLHPLQHRPHSTALRSGHILKGRFPTGGLHVQVVDVL